MIDTNRLFTNELRAPKYRDHFNPIVGHCYIACEVYYHLNPGKYKPHFMYHEGEPHWFLVEIKTSEVFDPTVEQFQRIPDYGEGKGKGFLTKQPSRRAQIVLDRITHNT